MPWPISTCGIISMVRPVSSMRMKALGANLPSVASFCTGSLAAARSGRWKASRKPVARPPVRSARRETLFCAFMADLTTDGRRRRA